MSVNTRKPLSRKFNIVCSISGRSPDLSYVIPPSHSQQANSGQEENNILIKRSQKDTYKPTGRFDKNLQLREQFRISTGFPFNPITFKPNGNQNSL
jgi:hypothetical protein